MMSSNQNQIAASGYPAESAVRPGNCNAPTTTGPYHRQNNSGGVSLGRGRSDFWENPANMMNCDLLVLEQEQIGPTSVASLIKEVGPVQGSDGFWDSMFFEALAAPA